MPKGYHHLTYEKRCQLQVLKESGNSIIEIAQALGIHRSVIYQELGRNSGPNGYKYEQAHEKASKRRRASSKRKVKMTSKLVAIIEEKLKLQWSPEQISGWLKRYPELGSISHEAIYQHVWKDKQSGGSLYKQLRHRGKKYNKRSRGKAGRGCIPGRIDIADRPSIVDEKSRVGDWELDTIVGKEHKGAIVSMVERHSKYTLLAKVDRKTAQAVTEALTRNLSQVKDCVLTLTADNGKEFANHQMVSEKLDANFYFARPYHSWERGLNEHTNGLVRQYLPKAIRLDEVSTEKIQEIQNLLNHRPRKALQFLTPMEVFNLHRDKTAALIIDWAIG